MKITQNEMIKVVEKFIVQDANRENSGMSAWDRKYYKREGDVLCEVKDTINNYFSLLASINLIVESKKEAKK